MTEAGLLVVRSAWTKLLKEVGVKTRKKSCPDQELSEGLQAMTFLC